MSEHPWFSLFLQTSIVLGFLCFVTLGLVLLHESKYGSLSQTDAKYLEVIEKLKKKHEEKEKEGKEKDLLAESNKNK